MTSAITLHGTRHSQIGSTSVPGQHHQKCSGDIAKTVELHRQNGSTGPVSFYECNTKSPYGVAYPLSTAAVSVRGLGRPNDWGVGE
jgi:hypothetical protein